MTTGAFAPKHWLEVWIGPDAAADHLVVLRPSDGGFALVDPQDGWRPLRHFTSYDAAAGWLCQEAFVPGVGRCALP